MHARVFSLRAHEGGGEYRCVHNRVIAELQRRQEEEEGKRSKTRESRQKGCQKERVRECKIKSREVERRMHEVEGTKLLK